MNSKKTLMSITALLVLSSCLESNLSARGGGGHGGGHMGGGHMGGHAGGGHGGGHHAAPAHSGAHHATGHGGGHGGGHHGGGGHHNGNHGGHGWHGGYGRGGWGRGWYGAWPGVWAALAIGGLVGTWAYGNNWWWSRDLDSYCADCRDYYVTWYEDTPTLEQESVTQPMLTDEQLVQQFVTKVNDFSAYVNKLNSAMKKQKKIVDFLYGKMLEQSNQENASVFDNDIENEEGEEYDYE